MNGVYNMIPTGFAIGTAATLATSHASIESQHNDSANLLCEAHANKRTK
jgi:hypothetical protein